jgi:hypothetical protein
MLQAADILGLKEHYVCEHTRVNAVRLAAAADIELHKGVDGRYYLYEGEQKERKKGRGRERREKRRRGRRETWLTIRLDYSRGMPPQDIALQKKYVPKRSSFSPLTPEFFQPEN